MNEFLQGLSNSMMLMIKYNQYNKTDQIKLISILVNKNSSVIVFLSAKTGQIKLQARKSKSENKRDS